MRLIDADKLLECVEASMLNNTHRNGNAALCHVSEHRHFIEMIVEQPTAFDLEKVIEQLDEEIGQSYVDFKSYAEEYGLDGEYDDCFYEEMKRAIEIIERGGRDEE